MKITTFLTFVNDQCGKAEEAMNLYTSLFPNSEIKSIMKYAEVLGVANPAWMTSRTGSLAVAKRMRNNEVIQDDKWNKNVLHVDYILNEFDRGAL